VITWNGIGEPTQNLERQVRVRLRNGVKSLRKVKDFTWLHHGEPGDIVAYEWVDDDEHRVAKPGAWIPVASMPPPVVALDESRRRKEQPLARGCMDYFPDALLAVAELSFLANEKHNPGEPMHWSKGKSNDHADCVARHLLERGTWITGEYARPVRHSAAAAWRALANLQTEIELEREQKAAA
jgi:hypothetical protein